MACHWGATTNNNNSFGQCKMATNKLIASERVVSVMMITRSLERMRLIYMSLFVSFSFCLAACVRGALLQRCRQSNSTRRKGETN